MRTIKNFLPGLLSLVLLAGLSCQAWAQATEVRILAVETNIHTIGGRSELWVDVLFDLNEETNIDLTGFPFGDTVSMLSNSDAAMVNRPELSSSLSYLRNGFRGKFIMNNNRLIEKLAHSPEGFYLGAVGELSFQTASDTLVLTAEELSSASLGSMQITTEQQQELLVSLSRNLHLYRNYFDFGFNPQEDLFALSLNYLYSRPYGQNQYGLYLFSEGRVSTIPDDTLNYLKIYPLNMNIYTDDLLRHHAVLRSGIEADQLFSTVRVNLGLNVESIIPNLIDLSYGHNRLRLKPVVSAGVSFYNELRVPDGKDKQSEFLFHGEIYYYIPIMEAYYLLLQGRTFYDTGRDPADAWNYNASIALGLELSSAPATIIARYIFGVNEITFEHDDQLLIGFAMDLFSAKGRTR